MKFGLEFDSYARILIQVWERALWRLFGGWQRFENEIRNLSFNLAC